MGTGNTIKLCQLISSLNKTTIYYIQNILLPKSKKIVYQHSMWKFLMVRLGLGLLCDQ